MVRKINKKFLNKNNFFLFSGTLSLLSLGMIGYSLQSTNALNNATWLRKQAVLQSDLQTLPLSKSLKSAEEYNAYFKKISQNPNGEDVSQWFDNPLAPENYPELTNGTTLIQLFKNEKIADAIMTSIKNAFPVFHLRNSGIHTVITQEHIAGVKEIDLSNANLLEVNYLLLNPNLQWTNLTSINLDNNNFSNYQLIFTKDRMPKLWKISARNSQLKYMVDVSSYVADPYDQTHDFLNGNPARNKDSEYNGRAVARAEYDTPLINNVPRYFDVANNEIRFIPKYYLKIALGYLDISNNQLGLGSASDPMGYYAIPSYSDDRAFIPSNTRALAIPDTDVKGPYGMNIYLTGDRKDGLFADGLVARWRAQPFPIRSLRFASYNAIPDADGNLDTGIDKNVWKKPTGSSIEQENDIKLPYFNFSVNSLNNIPIFWDARSNYDLFSSTKPQTKNTNIYVGIDEWKSSGIYKDVEKQKRYARFGDISAFDTDASFNPFFDYSLTNFNFDFYQQDRGFYYRAIEVSPRSFNGYDMFMIDQDERDLPNSGAGQVFSNFNLTKTRDLSVTNLRYLKGSNIKEGVKWSPYDISRNDVFVDNKRKSRLNEFWGVNYEKSFGGNLTRDVTTQTLMSNSIFLRTYVNTNLSYLLRGNRDNPDDPNAYINQNSAEAHLFYDYLTARRSGIATFGNSGIRQVRNPRANYFAEALQPENKYASYASWKGYSTRGFTNNGSALPIVHRKNSFVTNLKGRNSFGIAQDASYPPPYYSQYTKLFGGLGGYNYSSNYIVLENINSKFKNVDDAGVFAKSINTPLKNDGISIQSKYSSDDERPLVSQSVTNLDLKKGEGVFWDNKTQFDTEYMKVIDPNDIELVFDDEKGELTFKFRVYSPGYTTLGRLIRMGDESDPDATKTLDFWVINKITGFSPIGLWDQTNPDDLKLVSGKKTYNQNIEIQAPEDIKNQTIVSIKTEQIAKLFKTNYLGNKLISTFDSNLVELEKTQGEKSNLEKQWVNIIKYNPEEGEVEFKIDIPDYRFVNGNFMYFPKNLRDATFVLKGFKKLEVSYIGEDKKPFNLNSFVEIDKEKYKKLIAKPASEITALDIFNANIIVSNRPDWINIQNKSNQASQIFTNLVPNNTVGTLSFLIRLPGDQALSLSPFIRQVVWTGFLNDTTQVNWITQETLKEKFPDLNPNQLKQKFKDNPTAFFINFIDSYNNEEVLDEHIDTENVNFFLNVDTGDFRITNFYLKKYKKNGINFDQSNSSKTNDYLRLGASPNYKGALPPSNANWIDVNEAKKILLDTFVERQLIRSNNDVTPNVNIEQIKNQLTPAEAKIFFLRSNFNFEVLFSTLKNLSIKDIRFKDSQLANSLTADNQAGTLTIHDVSFLNWRNEDNSLSEKTLNDSLIIDFSKISTSFAWPDLLPLDLRFQGPHTFEQTFYSKKLAADFIKKLDRGVKFYDNDGNLKTKYQVDLNKVVLNTYDGILKFEKNAITVTQQYKNGKKIEDFLTPEKIYNLAITSSTRFIVNQEIATTSPVENKKQYLQFVNPGLKYEQLSQEEKSIYDQQYEALNPVDLNGVNVRDAIKTLKTWQVNNNKIKISEEDLIKIQELKAKNSALVNIDFTNFAYVPEFLFYLRKPKLNEHDPNRTYIIARTFEQSPIQENILIFRDVYIVNNYQNKIANITLLSQAISFYNFNQTTYLEFHDDNDNKGYKLLENSWKSMNAADVAAEFQFLFQNRAIKDSNIQLEFLKKRAKWTTMFTFGLVPNNGQDDPAIAYPSQITFDLYQRKVRIDELFFPSYFLNEAGKLPQKTSNIKRNYGQNAVFKVDKGDLNSHVVSVLDIVDDEVVNKSLEEILQNWGLSKGVQNKPEETANILIKKNVIKINGDGIDLFNSGTSKKATAKIGKIEIIPNLNNKTILKFSEIEIKDGWFEGIQKIDYQKVADLDIEFDLITTKVVPKKNLQGAIFLVYGELAKEWYGSYNVHNALSLWQKDLANTNDEDAQNRALQLITQMNELNGVVIEDGHEKTYLAFKNKPTPKKSLLLSTTTNLFNNLIISDFIDIKYTPTTIAITIQNLKIFNGYQESIETEEMLVQPLVLTLSNDYSTNFNKDTGNQKISKILNRNALNNAAVDKVQEFFYHNSALVLDSLFQAPQVDFSEQSDTPIITVDTNDLFGYVYITVHFKNFYVAGVDVGEKTFEYTFITGVNKLNIIIGSSVGVFVTFLLGIVIFVIFKKKRTALVYVKRKKP